MAAKKTLKAKTLEALGARRLAELLIEISARDAAVKHQLRLELAGTEGPTGVAREIRKRLAAIRRSLSFVDWWESQALADDLETLREAIVERVAKADAMKALDLMWSFMDLADSIFECCDDSNGMVGDVFRNACVDLGEIAHAAKADPRQLADRTLEAITNNDYAQYDGLINILKPALGQEGLEHLKQRMVELSNAIATRPANKDMAKIDRAYSDSISEEERNEQWRLRLVRYALRDIADAQGDVDGFIAHYDEETRKVPRIAAEIARRLLAAGRAEEALHALDASSHGDVAGRRWSGFESEDARIDVLGALERTDEAQQVRWGCFKRSLSMPHLRAYLERLADFDASEAKEQALDHVQKFHDRLVALSFFVSWPALDRASRLVVEHAESLNGDRYEILTEAARALTSEHPLAATLVLRAMINVTLGGGKSSRYRYAARDLLKCSNLSLDIQDFQKHETHKAYKQRLRSEHGRKWSFWNLID